MRRIRIRIRLKMYPVIWSIILLVSVYLLIRFAMISFSEDMGQAGFSEALVSKLCVKVLETGSSFVSYAAMNEKPSYEFPMSLVDGGLAINAFAKVDDSKNLSQEASYFQNDYNFEDEIETAVVDTNERKVREMDVYAINSDLVGMEYLLSNGAILRSALTGVLVGDETLIANQLQIGYLMGDISQLETEDEDHDSTVETSGTVEPVEYTLDELKDTSFLVRNFYIVDKSTEITESLFDAEEFLNKDMTIKQSNDDPQILIYHTHSQEAYIDSRPGKDADSVIGVGTYLTKILEEDYGYNVIHDKTHYDIVNGELDRNIAYNQAKDGISKILEDNPTIEVIIDLHRNSGAGNTVTVDGRETAQIMLFNGLCRDQSGPITYLDNPYLQDNLAFSFQLQLESKKLYPGLFYKNYLKSYRYNMHLRQKSLLVELGTVNNTLESAKNAMIPFAEILDQVLNGE